MLTKLETDPTIKFLIVTYLKGWRTGEDITYVAPRKFQEIIQEQQRLGWRRFFEGWLVTKWRFHQQRYYDLIKSQRTGKRWTSAIIQKLWGTAWDLWEHRNGVLHENENIITRSMTVQFHARVSRAYADLISRALSHNDCHLVSLPLHKLLEKDANYKITWLSIAEPAIQQCRRSTWQRASGNDRLVQSMRRTMFSWLQR